MPDSSTRRQARRMYGDAIEQQGRAWKPCAESVRGGFENLWITPALDAIETALRTGIDPDDDDSL